MAFSATPLMAELFGNSLAYPVGSGLYFKDKKSTRPLLATAPLENGSSKGKEARLSAAIPEKPSRFFDLLGNSPAKEWACSVGRPPGQW